jgi:polysaccharide biosynthesis protein PelF
MKICMLVEGSYPHVTGGVSTWVQILLKNLKEHQFIIFSVGAEEKYRGKFKYDFPPNVIGVKEIFLDEMFNSRGRYGKRYRLLPESRSNFKNLITGQKVEWGHIFDAIMQRRIKNEMDFFMSVDFFDLLKEAYEEKYSSIAFTEFFWTVRSMLVPLFFLLKTRLPEADIYHSAATGYAGILGAMCRHVYRKPFIVTEHGIYSREREEEIIKSTWAKGYFKDMWIKFFYNICGGVYEYADLVLTLFEKNRQIEIELGCPEEKLQIVPNGIDVKAFEVSDAYGQETKGNFINIGTITRVVPIKDIKTMLQSFNLVKKSLPQSKFYIMGPRDEDKQYYEECEKLIKRLKIEDVSFTGKVDIKQYVNRMDIMVLSSISEGQPFAILEGMAAKKPFVATDVGGCMELLYGRNDSFGKAGIVVPVMDSEKIAKSIIKLAENPDLRARMGQNGYDRVSELYGYEKCVQSYRQIYSKFEIKEKSLFKKAV